MTIARGLFVRHYGNWLWLCLPVWSQAIIFTPGGEEAHPYLTKIPLPSFPYILLLSLHIFSLFPKHLSFLTYLRGRRSNVIEPKLAYIFRCVASLLVTLWFKALYLYFISMNPLDSIQHQTSIPALFCNWLNIR